MNCNTRVVQVTNVSPSTTSEQMRTLFGFLGSIEELHLFPPDDSHMPVTSRVCFVKFLEPESVGVSQHLTNTVFVDRALIVVPFAEGVIPDESKAMSLLAPANAVAGMMPGGGLLPTPNPLMGASPFGLGAPTLEQMAAMGMHGPQALGADFLKLMQSIDPKFNPLAAGLGLSAGLKADASSKEIEEAMKRVREAQSLISAVIEPGSKKDDKRRHSRSRSRSRRTSSRSRHRRSRSRSRRRTPSRSRKSKSPRRRKSRSRDRSRRSRSRDRRKDEKSKKRSKTPPKSYSSARRSRSISRRHRRSRSASRSPRKKPSPSPRRHKKEKKKDKGREKERDKREERSRDERERSNSKKKKSKDKEQEREHERDREHKSDSEKGDVKVTRDYDEEEQGYDSDRRAEEEDERKSESDTNSSPKGPSDLSTDASKKSKLNGDQQEDMVMSD
ncbi:unnamed protein product [Knipowitschia caucasica]|uniref:RRM domain-containing protein n=1 Tax=Knipowitschia caucasica TaxID=637954 RepID=A0AAV2KXY2_KNICA